MRTVVAVVVALAAFAAVAHAAPPGLTEPQLRDDDKPMDPDVVVPPAPPQKSPQVAVALSIGATVAGYAMIAKSGDNADVAMTGALLAFLGPSTGQWYAGKVGGLGIGTRSVALGLLMYAALHATTAECDDCGLASRDRSNDENTTRDILIAAGALWVGSTIYDFVEAYRQTDNYNQRQRAMARQFVPTVMPGANNTVVPGMAYSMHF